MTSASRLSRSSSRRHRTTSEAAHSFASAVSTTAARNANLSALEAERARARLLQQLPQYTYVHKPPIHHETPVDAAMAMAPAPVVAYIGHDRSPTPAFSYNQQLGVAPGPAASVMMSPLPARPPVVHVSGQQVSYAQYITPPPTPSLAFSLYPVAFEQPSILERLLQLPVLIEPFHQVMQPSCGIDGHGLQPFETVVINLKKREDRRQHMRSQLAAAHLSAVRFEAQTGADAPDWAVTTTWDSTLNSKFDDKTVPHPRLAMTPGERGCAMSHALLWAAIACRPDDARPLLILEDDVELLSPTFGAETAALVASVEATFLPAEREVVLYVGAHVPKWRSRRAFPVLPGRVLREADYAWQTSSYLIWPAAARALLAAMPIDCPVDNYMSKFFLEHSLRALVCLPNIAAQSSPYRDGDILHSNVFKPRVSVEPSLRRALEESQASIGEKYEVPGQA